MFIPRFFIYFLFLSFGYWITAFLLMESIEPFLNAHFYVDVLFTITVFVVYFLLIYRAYKKSHKKTDPEGRR